MMIIFPISKSLRFSGKMTPEKFEEVKPVLANIIAHAQQQALSPADQKQLGSLRKLGMVYPIAPETSAYITRPTFITNWTLMTDIAPDHLLREGAAKRLAKKTGKPVAFLQWYHTTKAKIREGFHFGKQGETSSFESGRVTLDNDQIYWRIYQ